MKCRTILFSFGFLLIYLSTFHLVDCIRFLQRFHSSPVNYYPEYETIPFQPNLPSIQQRVLSNRQTPFISSVLAGPLALATFLFTLPLLPSLLMAPLAVAGIPSALSVLSNIAGGISNGKPFVNILSALSDPLHSENTSDSDKPSSASGTLSNQIDTIRSIARLFRDALTRRNTVIKNTNPLQEPSSPQEEADKIPEPLDIETNEILDQNSLNVTRATNASLSAADMEKSIRTMDAVFSSVREVYSVIRNGLRRYEITDSECQSRIVCEIHQKVISHNKMLKSFSLNALDVLGLEKSINSLSTLNDKSKRTIKIYLNAAKVGFAGKDCAKEFGSCPTLNTRSLALKSFLFTGRHLVNKLL